MSFLNRIFVLVSFSFLLTACTSQLGPSQTSSSSLDWSGSYSGVVPCASCPGIETKISLSNDGTFSRSMRYVDEDTTPLIDTGTFVWNESGNEITLDLGDEKTQQFRVDEYQLTQLDQQGQLIEGELAELYILSQHMDDSRIENQNWRLTELNGQPVTLSESQRPASLKLFSEDQRVGGSASCNSYSGEYVIKPDQRISFSKNMAMTKMACPDMKLEQEFVEMMRRVERYGLDNEGSLMLYASETVPLARFVAEESDS